MKKHPMAMFKLSWLLLLVFLVPSSISSSYFASSSTIESQPSYADHCASVVPEPTQQSFHYTDISIPSHSGYYKGGSNLLSQNSSYYDPVTSLVFRISTLKATDDVRGLFKIEGHIVLHRSGTYYRSLNHTRSHPNYFSGGMYYNDQKQDHYSRRRGRVRFILSGFWSESSGKLCMTGWYYSRHASGNSLYQPAVLKLYNFKNSTTAVSGLITGSLESLNSENDLSFFKPVSIMIFPVMNYEYRLVSEENFSGVVENDGPLGLPLASFPRQALCSLFPYAVNAIDLRFAGHCRSSAKNCTPFCLEIERLPPVAMFSEIVCSEGKQRQRLRALIKFPPSIYDETFNPNTTLVGEGLWDSKKNQLNLVGCRFLGVTENSFADAHVGDCSIRLSLKYPSVWTIKNSNSIMGKMWSGKHETELGYFDMIRLERSYASMPPRVSGLNYNYTKTDKATMLCSRKKHANEEGAIYPYPFSQDMSFDMNLGNAKRLMAWGYFSPLFVGKRHYSQVWYSGHYFNSTFAKTKPVNISYQIGISLGYGAQLSDGASIFNMSSRWSSKVGISAEGIYDYSTGKLCLTGCRNLDLSDQLMIDGGPVDCEIRMDVQFSGRNSDYSSGYIKGSIQSTRKKSDPLHFETLDFSSSAIGTAVAIELISRMDVEIIMVVISTTLACVFLGTQLFHLKRHPDVPAFMSLFMLSVQTLGYMIPLMLNFEALFTKSANHQSVLTGSGGWLEANEVIIRVMTMIAFLLQFRLLQLAWSARSSNGAQNESWIAEKEASFVALPIYAAGALLTMFVTWRKSKYDHVLLTSSLTSYQEDRVWDAFKSYVGLVSDGFLLPQILLNIFRNSRENALSCSFYLGITFVRLLPHAYDLYTGQSSARYQSSIFVNPVADFYSTAWDLIISFGGVLFVLIIFLQQKFGGRCIFTFRFKTLDVLQKVPTASEA